jgi:glycosyltransferase involved in cell wall biosynthesis
MTIGIVTVSFNQAGFLQEAIDSVSVTMPDRVDYVIVDPGSSDGSRAVIEQNRGRFNRIVLEPDQGAADGLNKGFARCDANILGYLNSDDRFVAGALDFVADYFRRHTDIDLLLGAIRIIDAAGTAKLRGRAPDRMDVRKYICGVGYAWQQATFFRRELFDRTGFNPANRSCWDAELVLDMALAGARIGYTNTILGDFRIHGESMTGSGQQSILQKSELVRLRAKAAAAGYQPFPDFRERWERVKYRHNLVRHWKCLFGIRLPAIRSAELSRESVNT